MGFGARIPRLGGAVEPRLESARDDAGGSLRAAVQQSEGAGAGLFAARHGRRPQRRRLGGAGQRSHGQLRSPQVQRPAERPTATGPALPRRLDAVSGAAAAVERRDRVGQRRSQLLHVGRLVQHVGFGDNTPINTGNASEGLLVLKDGKWVVLRVPYPTGFYTKWMDGRIDDPKAGWKGRGLWATISTRTPFHMETGKGTTSKVMHFQLRPDPLAK